MNDRPSASAGGNERTEEHGSHMMWFVGQLLMIPVAALVYSVELLVKTLHGMQDATNQGLEAVVGGGQAVQVESSPQTVENGAGGPQTIDAGGGNAGLANTGTTQKEENTLSNEGGIIGLDKDLHDDMLKLVRYKILFVKREYEHAFPEKEDLVSDNMDGNAFTAWKVAEFIQELQSKDREKTRVPKKWADKHYPGDDYSADGYLTGLPEGDKKYLRVYYEVLDRYPREKFKYEEQQIRVLEQIRDHLTGGSVGGGAKPAGMPGSGGAGASVQLPDPYSAFTNYFQLSAPVFAKWREDFARCSDGMAKSLARILNKYRMIGFFTPPEITEEELRDALSQTKPKFDRNTLDRFTGKTESQLSLYAPPDGNPVNAPPGFSIWAKAREQDGKFTQKITGSNFSHTHPEDSKGVWDAMAKTQVDLIYNAYTPEVGIVSWSMFRENDDNQLRSIGYEVNGKLLWINEMLNPDGTKTVGKLPGIVPEQIVTPNQYIISIDFLQEEGKDKYFCIYALHIDLDFDKCSAKYGGRILEMRHKLLGPA